MVTGLFGLGFTMHVVLLGVAIAVFPMHRTWSAIPTIYGV